MLRGAIDFGGLIPESHTSTLRVAGDHLFGIKKGQSQEILGTNIVSVREYFTKNPFLEVTTTDGDFHVGLKSEHYDDVVRVLQTLVGDDFCRKLTHRLNVLFYRKQFTLKSLVEYLSKPFRREGRR